MKISIQKVAAICVILTAFFSSCSKSEAGPKGDAGPQGPPGNANVITTNSVELNQWVLDDPSYYSVVTSTAITQEIVDNGLVMVYLRNDGWIPLPFTGLNTATDILTYELTAGKITLFYYDNAEGVDDPSSWGLTVKIVIVPPSLVRPGMENWESENVLNFQVLAL